MTTITTLIRPTPNLIHWRQEHSSRYSTRLSDYRPSARVNSAEPSCIRSHKAWMIEHTMYVTSQEGGTCVFRSPNPKEFHEMLWDIGSGKTGKLVKEERAQPKRVVSPEYGQGKRNDTIETKKSRLTVLEAGERWTLLHASKHGRTTGEHRRTGDENSIKHRSWFPGIFGLNNLAPVQTPVDLKSVPLPEGCAMPHAIFARKFALVADGVPLPTSLSHELMPTADIKARNLLVEAAAQGLMNPTYEFRGPFTPQLGFDGGLDHQYISTGAVTSALASYKAAYHIPQPNHGDSPPLIKPQRYQRGHDWFGLDAPTSQSRSANRSLRGSEKPKDAHGTSQWKTNGRHAYPADNWYGLDGAGNKENGLRRTVAIMNVG
ncbi:hypothetical protein C8034_v011005 [Colletotrichum sidae]|uniref:Uncharacterized protein n=1 Tax=Colletotrichum sidae TaxID=1347389 RepID=A0A4R8T132_9PEZI|nr:hypothetical protein C8034_v011005 [Colletotrichum sidae]